MRKRLAQRWRHYAAAHPVLSNIGILATGTAGAQAIAITVSVVTARLFTPEAFGEFALYSSIAGIFMVIATLRYDLAIVLPESDDSARLLARLSTRANLVVSALAVVLALAARPLVLQIWGSETLATWLPLVGLTVLCTAQVSIWQYWFNRKRQYRIIALNRFEQSVGVSGGQLGLGLAGMRSFLGLVLGSFVGLLWALFNLWRQSDEVRRPVGEDGASAPGGDGAVGAVAEVADAVSMREVAREYRKMPLLNLPNALVDAVRTNGIQMLVGAVALGALGQFSLAWRVLQAPIALLNGAISQVFLERMARVRPGELTALVRAVMKRAVLLGVAPFALLWVLAPWLIPLVFGPQWEEAGYITRALVPWLGMNLITSPLSGVFVVTSKQQWILAHAVIFTVIPLGWLAFSPLEFLATLQVLSIAMALMLALLVFMADLAARAYDKTVPPTPDTASATETTTANLDPKETPVTETGAPEATIVIACHDSRRPLRRAVASVLRSRGACALVVAHNLEAEVLRGVLGDLAGDPRVGVVELRDGIHSPAGPFNHGLALVGTPFGAVMGSDDVLEDGAVDAWLELARRYRAQVVLTRLGRGGVGDLVGEGGAGGGAGVAGSAAGCGKRRPVHTPPVRPWLRGPAHFVRDRLYYRSAPLGLLEMQQIRRLGLQMTTGLAVGEDLAFSMRLYCASRVVVQRCGPGYLVGEDGPARVTLATRPVEAELAHIPDLLERAWMRQWSSPAREGLAVKTLRIHVFGLVTNRAEDWWDNQQRRELAAMARRVLDFAPGCQRVFSRADTALLRDILNPNVPAAQLLAHARARRRHVSLNALVAARGTGWWHREGPLRFAAASFLVR